VKRSLVILSCLALIASASLGLAGTIVITPATEVQWSVKRNPPKQPSVEEIESVVGVDAGTLTLFYQKSVDSTLENGPFADSYSTAFFNTPTDPEDAVITYGGGAAIGGSSLYLLVKDGNSNPTYYLFNLLNLNVDLDGDGDLDTYKWNGTDQLYLDGFWPQKGAISNVAIYGSTHVPDGGLTVLLLGIGVGGAALFSRKFRK
jgi:hypothetical protein